MRIILVLFLFLQPICVLAWPSQTTHVIDGDTLVVVSNQQEAIKIRLYGIDCPEMGQADGPEAATFAELSTVGASLDVEALYNDRYGRTVAILFLPDGASLQEMLISAGFAWVDARYCKRPECQDWKELEQTARAARVGLWKQSRPIPPWEWRKGIHSRPRTRAR